MNTIEPIVCPNNKSHQIELVNRGEYGIFYHCPTCKAEGLGHTFRPYVQTGVKISQQKVDSK